MQLSLSSEDLPEGMTGLKAAEGVGTHAPAFDGTITVVLAGTDFEVPVVAVDGTVYAQIPLTPGWSDVDPAEYGAPDPATLMSPDAGFSSLLPGHRGPRGGRERPRRRGQQGGPHRVHRHRPRRRGEERDPERRRATST